MHWIMWSLVANGGIFFIEYVYRTAKFGSFFHSLPYVIIPILLSQFGLSQSIRHAPSLFIAGITFSVINLILRTVNSIRLGEIPNAYQWCAIGCMALASVLIRMK